MLGWLGRARWVIVPALFITSSVLMLVGFCRPVWVFLGSRSCTADGSVSHWSELRTWYVLGVYQGGIALERSDRPTGSGLPGVFELVHNAASSPAAQHHEQWRCLGLEYHVQRNHVMPHYLPRRGARGRLIYVPYWDAKLLVAPLWVVALPTGVVTALRVIRHRRRARREDEGLCPECGYDLRATPGRCPECGRR